MASFLWKTYWVGSSYMCHAPVLTYMWSLVPTSKSTFLDIFMLLLSNVAPPPAPPPPDPMASLLLYWSRPGTDVTPHSSAALNCTVPLMFETNICLTSGMHHYQPSPLHHSPAYKCISMYKIEQTKSLTELFWKLWFRSFESTLS